MVDNKMKITMEEVAKRAGVSKTTVSRIINGNYEYVNETTKEKVLKVINELNYKPNALAKSLKQVKTNVIGIVLSNLQNPFWSQVLEGAEDICRNSGYNLMICNSNDDPKLEEEFIEDLKSKQVDGIIVNPTMKNKSLYQQLVDNKYPMVAINRKIEGIHINTITVDNVKGSMLAVQRLIDVGRKSIALIIYPPNGISPRLERIEGYKAALTNNGIEIDKTLIKIIDERKGSVKETVHDLLNQKHRPDAIFSTNNMMTLEILEGLKELNIKVPEDLSLIGYDETVWAKHLAPPLTTVNQPSYQMGERAAMNLIELLKKKGDNEVEITLLQPNLIIRESCAK